MTKQVRIENADTSDHKVAVYTEELVDGVWVRSDRVELLQYPTSMSSLSIYSTRRLVIEETK